MISFSRSQITTVNAETNTMMDTASVQQNGNHMGGKEQECDSKTNLIINYLPQTMTQDDIRSLFTSIGELESCKLIRDKTTGRSSCFVGSVVVGGRSIGTNLIINYLPQTMTRDDIRSLFTSIGELECCKLIRDKTTGRSSCFVGSVVVGGGSNRTCPW